MDTPSVLPNIEGPGEILLVDDSPASLKLLSLWLEDDGHVVRQAPSGELALWTLQTRHPDLILLDVRMPTMDGFETCRRLKADARTQDIPVIFLSAANDAADRIRGLQIGAVDFVLKSFQQDEVLARVRTHLTLSRMQKALVNERTHLELRVQQRTEEIERQKDLLQQVVDSFPDWIFVKDHEHRFLLVNRPMSRAFGLKPEDMLGRQDAEVLATTTQQALPDIAHISNRLHAEDRIALSGQEVQGELREWSAPHGEERSYESFKAPLRDRNGQITGILGYRRDVTDKHKGEEARKEVETQLWRAQKMQAIGQLTGGIAHDFNNILATVLGFSEFARTALKAGRTEKLDYYLSEILQGAQIAKELVAQLLTFSRGDESEADPIDAAPALQEIGRLLEATLGPEMRVRLDISPFLPHVRVRPIHLHQMVMNLGINARDACNQRGRIEISAAPANMAADGVCASCHSNFHGDFLRISIADHGSGIPPEHLSRIFDPFFTTKEVGKGTGLGLSVTHGIVHSAGGHLQVSSKLGVGTRFDLFLPLTNAAPGHAREQANTAGDAAPGARLLVVDDEASIVALMTELFEFKGCIVTGLTDPLQALARFHAAPGEFDLAIIDQSMPGKNGTELAQELSAVRPDLPIILCSGFNAPANSIPADSIHRFLMKPVACDVLESTVNELLRLHTKRAPPPAD